MQIAHFIMALRAAKLTPQQFRTLKGQALAGDLEGAIRGLKKIKEERNAKRRKTDHTDS